MNKKIEKLLEKVSRLEQAAQHGLHFNTIEELKNGPGTLISPEQCNNTIANCKTFRKWINECFGS